MRRSAEARVLPPLAVLFKDATAAAASASSRVMVLFWSWAEAAILLGSLCGCCCSLPPRVAAIALAVRASFTLLKGSNRVCGLNRMCGDPLLCE